MVVAASVEVDGAVAAVELGSEVVVESSLWIFLQESGPCRISFLLKYLGGKNRRAECLRAAAC